MALPALAVKRGRFLKFGNVAYVIALSDRRQALRRRLGEQILRGSPDERVTLKPKAWAVGATVAD